MNSISKDFRSGFADIGLHLPDLLLPAQDIDQRLWPVIACDQFTSEPEYWERVERLVGSSPSTLRLILPECFLDRPDTGERIAAIRRSMYEYLESGFFRKLASAPILVNRETGSGRRRTGLLLAVDLEAYDYRPGARSLIQPSEGTILDRIPPRLRIRRGAPIELPHILLLADDRENTLLPPIRSRVLQTEPVYRTDLMMGGGTVEGYRVPDGLVEEHLLPAFRSLLDPERFRSRYGSSEQPFLLAVGDGNHSLATARALWEELKQEGASADHPARYALAEIVNLYDTGLPFEPIHRVIFGIDPEPFLSALASDSGGRFEESRQSLEGSGSRETFRESIREENQNLVLFRSARSTGMLTLPGNPDAAAVTVQESIDRILPDFPGAWIDYIHGWESAFSLGSRDRSAALLLPAIPKDRFFRRILEKGPFPRKTFSLGEAEEKRYYLEARRIIPET